MGLGNCLLPERWKTQRDVSLAAFCLFGPGCPHQRLYCLSLPYSCTMTGMLCSGCSAAVHTELSCLHLLSHYLCQFWNRWPNNIKKKKISDMILDQTAILPHRQIKYHRSSSHSLSSFLHSLRTEQWLLQRGEEEAHEQQYFFPTCWGGS